jgi:2-dehydropantoate 2-reductase
VLVVATKATGLRESLERILAPPDLVVPLLNGLDHIALLREHFGAARVAAGSIRIESTRSATGVIVHTSPFLRIDLAADDPALRPGLEALATRIRRAEIPVEIGPSEAQILWSKLVRLNALACTTSAIDRPVGFIRADPEWRPILVACLEEAAAVANADGARIDVADALAEIDQVHPELETSMQRDIAAGRELACPTIERLVAVMAERAGASVRG